MPKLQSSDSYSSHGKARPVPRITHTATCFIALTQSGLETSLSLLPHSHAPVVTDWDRDEPGIAPLSPLLIATEHAQGTLFLCPVTTSVDQGNLQ